MKRSASSPARYLVSFCLLFLALTPASASAGETYWRPYDPEMNSQASYWAAGIPSPEITTCGPTVKFDRKELFYSTDSQPGSTKSGGSPPSVHANGLDVNSTGATHGFDASYYAGGDTGPAHDHYIMIRMVGRGANLFFDIRMEAEDGEGCDYSIRYEGSEDVTVTTDSKIKALSCTLDNTYCVEWRYFIKDMDAVNSNDFSEDKYMLLEWTGILHLIDNSKRMVSKKHEMLKPGSGMKTFSAGIGLGLSGGASLGSGNATYEGKAGLDLTLGWSQQNHYTNFHQDEHGQGPDPKVVQASANIPCPSLKDWHCRTTFSGDFTIKDYTSDPLFFDGSDGGRIEFYACLYNYVSSVTIKDCSSCDVPYPPPPPEPPPLTPPPLPPGPTTPGGGYAPPPPGLESAPGPAGNEVRDTDGDGFANGTVIGPLGWMDKVLPDFPNPLKHPFFGLGVAHRGPFVEEGFVRIDRWIVGGADEVITGALVDPWNQKDGSRALVTLKDIKTGECRLAVVLRNAEPSGAGVEHWPDREEAVPRTDYETTIRSSVSLSEMLPGEHVGGGRVLELEVDGERHVWLLPILVGTQVNELNGQETRTHLPSRGYEVTRGSPDGAVLSPMDD